MQGFSPKIILWGGGTYERYSCSDYNNRLYSQTGPIFKKSYSMFMTFQAFWCLKYVSTQDISEKFLAVWFCHDLLRSPILEILLNVKSFSLHPLFMLSLALRLWEYVSTHVTGKRVLPHTSWSFKRSGPRNIFLHVLQVKVSHNRDLSSFVDKDCDQPGLNKIPV